MPFFSCKDEIAHKEVCIVFNLEIYFACLHIEQTWYNRWILSACQEYNNGICEMACACHSCNFSTKAPLKTHKSKYKNSAQY
jgi:hypothetical protein